MTARATRLATWGWRLFFVVLALNFLLAVGALLAGDYDHIGLPPRMQPMEIVNNGLEALAWLAVSLLSLTRHPRFAPELAVFLAGFLWFDVLTTHVLSMPIPAGFLWWGSAACALMVMGGRHLAIRRADAEARSRRPARSRVANPAARSRVVVALSVFTGVVFASTVVSLARGDYAASGLPASVLPWHGVGNAIESALWFAVATLAWIGRSVAAGWLALFGTGMFAWDMLTTAFLPAMPIPHQQIWGPVAVVLMLSVGRSLRFPETVQS